MENKYYQILDKILRCGKKQSNKKGDIIYLLNEQLSLSPSDLLMSSFLCRLLTS